MKFLEKILFFCFVTLCASCDPCSKVEPQGAQQCPELNVAVDSTCNIRFAANPSLDDSRQAVNQTMEV